MIGKEINKNLKKWKEAGQRIGKEKIREDMRSVRHLRGRKTYFQISALQFTQAGVKFQADAISILEL